MKKKLLALMMGVLTLVQPAWAIEARDPLANLPSLGEAGGGELSTNDERRLGELIMRDYRNFGAVTEDVDITSYITKVGNRMVIAAGENPANFEFFLVADRSINAFAMPGGFIGVHTGLLANAQSEGELASVLAHEVGHVTQRHIARRFGQQKQASLVSAAAMIAAILVASTNPQAAQGLAAAGAGYSIDQQLGFSRDAEREADRIGFLTLGKAGYRPDAMVDFFGRLQQSSRLYENNAPVYLRTHPLTGERIADIRNRVVLSGRGAESMSGLPPVAADAEFALLRIKAVVLGDKTPQQLNDRLKTLNQPLPQMNLGDPVALAYGRSLVLDGLNRRQEALEALTQAQALWAKQRGADAANVAVPLMLRNQEIQLKVALRAQQNPSGSVAPAATPASLNAQDQALLAQLESYRQSFRGEMSVRVLYARGLYTLGLYEANERYLRDLLSVYRTQFQLLDLMAQNDLALGKRASHHFHLSQAYAARGAYLPALEQIRIAKQFAKDDYYMLAEIDARQREYRQRVDEERLAEKRFQ